MHPWAAAAITMRTGGYFGLTNIDTFYTLFIVYVIDVGIMGGYN
jgi:hypothetical protein